MIYNIIGLVASLILLAYLKYIEIKKKKGFVWFLYPIVGTMILISLFFKIKL